MIAVVGMAGRFPGARNVDEFWRNLRAGVESIARLDDSALLAAGVSPAELADPNYVRAAAILDGFDHFDAAFFGMSPKDAAIMDPQHRLFLECAWEALESTGWTPAEFDGRIGVFAGSGLNSYLIHNLLNNRRLVADTGLFALKQTGNDKDVLATRVSYQLNLTGPSITVQTACSTSLVAIHLAAQSLLNHECDMALAGGVTIEVPHGQGYTYREREILSRDGHCRAFDAESSGTVFGSGLGIVVLRRLSDAQRDGDHIRAVVRGTAINNDGARKVGYLAPSVAGQAEVITEAVAVADIPFDSISYIEAHGTGTAVGDPIEVTALAQAFRQGTAEKNFCAIASVKTNIGHLDAAAGVAGFIKTVLALEHRELPPSLNFSAPNPLIDFANSPFYVNTQLREWPAAATPRRAGVTALGIGGTNAHVILEEPPVLPCGETARPWQLLTLSAKTRPALDALSSRMADYLADDSVNLADAAYTSHRGRAPLPVRRAVVRRRGSEAAAALARTTPEVIDGVAGDVPPPIIFLFPGQGSQHVGMGRELYEHEPVFRTVVDSCAEILQQLLGIDLRTVIFPISVTEEAAARQLDETRLTQPALFVIEFATAKLFESWAIRPTAMIGHSIGELTAACLAGVFSLEDALQIVAERGRLMQLPAAGAMTAVAMRADQVRARLGARLSVASVNAPDQCVVSGPEDEIGDFERALGSEVPHRRLRVSHAFHSPIMDEILPSFSAFLRQFPFASPAIPFVSSATGDWFTPQDAADPEYWCRQLRNTVKFSDGAALLLKEPNAIFVEIGPGHTLGALIMRQPEYESQRVVPSIGSRTSDADEAALRALGELWAAGCKVNWRAFHDGEIRRVVDLPTYPFEHRRYWIDPDARSPEVELAPETESPSPPAMLFQPVWQAADRQPNAAPSKPEAWLIFLDREGLGDELARQLEARGERCYRVSAGAKYARPSDDLFEIDPDNRSDYERLLNTFAGETHFPGVIVHLWSVFSVTETGALPPALDALVGASFTSLLYLGQALGAAELPGIVRLAIVSNSLEQLPGESSIYPARSLLVGPCSVIPHELPNVHCRRIDLALPASPAFNNGDRGKYLREAAANLLYELQGPPSDAPVVHRGARRWQRVFKPVDSTSATPTNLRTRGVYLITGGLGGIGLAIARTLAEESKARLVLLARTPVPPRETWPQLAASQGAIDSAAIRQLIELEALGAQVLALASDVTDEAAMRNAVSQVHSTFGEINGVIHCAGIRDDAPMLRKSEAGTLRVITPKLEGTLALAAALGDEHLDFLLLMSSISATLGTAGQIDYAAANSFLDAYARQRTRVSSYPVIAVQWPRWRETGMAADRADHLLGATDHPLLQNRIGSNEKETIYLVKLDSTRDWILAEHRLRHGPALFPGAAYVDLIYGALRPPPGQAVTISDLFFTSPVAVSESSTHELRLHLAPSGNSAYTFHAEDANSQSSAVWFRCAQGNISRGPAKRPWLDLDAIRSGCRRGTRHFDEAHQNPTQEKHIAFGRRWRSLLAIDFGDDEALATVEMPSDFRSDFEQFPIHPALLDIATGAAMFLVPDYQTGQHLYVPASYGRVTIYGELTPRCYSHILFKREASADTAIAVFDIVIANESGDVLVEVLDFIIREVRDPAVLTAPAPSAAMRPERMPPSSSQATNQVAAISTAEGLAVLKQIFAAPLPNLVVYPGNLNTVSDGLSSNHLPRSTEPRAPALKIADEVEARLLAWWRELLGVPEAGRDEDFFALGGQSLTAVRLLAKVKKHYGVELDLAILFKAPTVAKLAQLIRRDEAPAAYRSIVPIRPVGAGAPLFLVHALGGRVIGYGDLARHLPADQIVYGVEFALPDSDPGHFRLENFAASYLLELRRAQPHGPYYLLGFSFGGLLAYEMAQQLTRQGERVAFLGMLDTWQTGHLRELDAPVPRPRRAVDRAQRLFRNACGELAAATELRQIFGKLTDRGVRFLTDLAGAGRRRLYSLIEHLGLRVPASLQFVNDINWYAVERYRFLPYPGRVTLFRASHGIGAADHRYGWDLGWSGLAKGGVEIHPVTSDHLGILREPSVRELANEITRCLVECHKTSDAPRQQLHEQIVTPLAAFSAIISK